MDSENPLQCETNLQETNSSAETLEEAQLTNEITDDKESP